MGVKNPSNHPRPGELGLKGQSIGIKLQDSVLTGGLSIQTSSPKNSCCESGQFGKMKCSLCDASFCFVCNQQPFLGLNSNVFSLYFYAKKEIRKFGLMSVEVERRMAQTTSGGTSSSLEEQWRRHFESLSTVFVPSRTNTLNIGPFCRYHLQEQLNSLYSDAMKRDRQREAYCLRNAKMQDDYARYREKNPSREEKIKAVRDAEELDLYLLANGYYPYLLE